MKKTEFPSAFFITGTDTGVGKTVVSAILARGLLSAYWKPVQSGLDEMTDTQTVKMLTGLPDRHFFPETYRLNHPLSPHLSARRDGISISLEKFVLPASDAYSHLIVEGAGGVMAPLNDECFILDLMKKLNLPVLLVARSGLGTINHTLLSLDMMRRNGLHVFGAVMNGPVNPGNREAIESFGNIHVIAEIEHMGTLNPDSIGGLCERHFFSTDT
ncbi:MAG: dethiobiotin synthase [Proteobacteria bacterium]|nr:dethiobiotin synthase [Pseudomonadota bacterium]